MKIPESNHLSLFHAIIEDRGNLIAVTSAVLKDYFAGYAVFVSRKEKNRETLWDIWGDAGSACCVFKDGICNHILLYPNTLEVSDLLSEKCDSLLRRKGVNTWVDDTDNFIIEKYGTDITFLYYELRIK